jgi:hypothetical protein
VSSMRNYCLAWGKWGNLTLWTGSISLQPHTHPLISAATHTAFRKWGSR